MRMSTMPGERLVLTWFFLPPYEGSNGVEREVRTPWMDACVLEWVREKKKNGDLGGPDTKLCFLVSLMTLGGRPNPVTDEVGMT